MTNDTIRIHTEDGLTLSLVQDDEPLDPREYDNLGTMYCSHRRYSLGDQTFTDPVDFLIDLLGIQDDLYSNPHWQRLHDLESEVEYLLGHLSTTHIVIPLYLYDHGGLVMSTRPFACPWDSGQVGWIMVSKDKVCEIYNWTRLTWKRRAQIHSYFDHEVDEYNHYLRGEAYGFRITDHEDNELDSCWGYYDDDLAWDEGMDSLRSALAMRQYQDPKGQLLLNFG